MPNSIASMQMDDDVGSPVAREGSEGVDVGRLDDCDDRVNKRYLYGELRLNRINWIYRLAPRFMFHQIIRGYHFNYQKYSGIFERNFAWLIVVFAYVTIVLMAMQLGLATSELKDDDRFNRASFGFTVLSILVPVTAVGIMLLMLIVFFIYNLVAQLAHMWIRRVQRRSK